jgi:hypothetical protein
MQYVRSRRTGASRVAVDMSSETARRKENISAAKSKEVERVEGGLVC